jgi:hypothetical protein
MSTGENYYAHYERIRTEKFESLKAIYQEIIANARDWKTAHELFNTSILRKGYETNGIKSSNTINTNEFHYQWDNTYKLDSSKDMPQIFNELIEYIEPAKRNESVQVLAELSGLDMMTKFWFNEIISKSQEENISQQNPIEDSEPQGNKEFSTARQVLAVHYLLKHLNVNNIDHTAKARFVQFLTNKETGAKEIKNTRIYKYICSPLKKDEKSLIADLQFIRVYFENLGLTNIVEEINKEIGNGG